MKILISELLYRHSNNIYTTFKAFSWVACDHARECKANFSYAMSRLTFAIFSCEVTYFHVNSPIFM